MRGSQAVSQLSAEGRNAVTLVPLDVTSQKSLSSAAEQIKSQCNGLDILVNNAGIIVRGRLDADGARRTIDTNYYGILNTYNTMAPLLRPNAR